MKIRILGRVVAFVVSIFAVGFVVLVTRMITTTEAIREVAEARTTPQFTTVPSSIPISVRTATIMPTGTSAPSVTPIPTQTKSPIPSLTSTLTIIDSGYVERCMKRDFEGIHHCTMGPYEIIRIDPKNPSVRFETVMPLGYNRDGHYGECRDVYVPDNHPYGKSPGPGCYVDDHYPGEQISSMANRYPGSVVAFNGDFFSPAYAFGPIGLTVKNGSRLDGYYDDGKLKEVQRSSISIAKDGEVRIGIVPRNKLPNPEEPWGWQPEPLAYYNTIGGLPQLVEGGYPVDLNSQCILEEGWCPDQNIPRARTAVGKTIEGHLFVVVAPEASGLTLLELSHLMVELGAIEAINLDGGGSSQLWYAGEYLVFSPRPIAEGMLVFSESVQITNIGEMGSYKSQIPE